MRWPTSFQGFATLLRLALRRDAVRLTAWLAGIVGWTTAMATSLPRIYPTPAERAAGAMTIDNPGSTALIGPIYSAADYTYAVMLGHQTMVVTGVFVALMTAGIVVRHTRADEETGRAELLWTAPVGRHAGQAAALALAVLANLVLALVLTSVLTVLPIDSIDPAGGFVYAVAVAAVGLVFAGVALVVAQLTQHARTATGVTGLVLAVAFVVRAIGDTSGTALSWASPLAWSQHTWPFHENRWSPLLLSLAAVVALTVVAALLSPRRDVGMGLLAPRAGRAHAAPRLATPLGLALRLNRTTIWAWSGGMLLFGLMYGPVLSEAETLVADIGTVDEMLPQMRGASGTELFAAVVVGLAALVATVPALQVVLRLRGEESGHRLAPLLTTPVRRGRWVGAHVTVAVATAALVLASFGVGFGASAAVALEDTGLLGDLLLAAVAYLPAVVVVVGLGAALFGLVPRAAPAAWAVLLLGVVTFYFGTLLDLPAWLQNLSPFSHVPAHPAQDLDVVPLLGLGAAALVLLGVAAPAFARREINRVP